MKMQILVLVLLLFSVGCQNLPGSAFPKEIASVKSWEKLSLNRFSNILNSARAEKKSWVNDPSQFAFHLLNLSDTRDYRIDYQATRVENNDKSVITIVRDGFMDDAIRGDIHQFQVINEQGLWQLMSVKRSFRCWRTIDMSYSSKLCP